MSRFDSIYILNTGPDKLEGMVAGFPFTFPPGKVVEVPYLESETGDGLRPVFVPARTAVNHLMEQKFLSGLVEYSFTERDEVGIEAYHTGKRIEGYTKFVEEIDKQLDTHNRMNDALQDAQKQRRPPTPALRRLLVVRNKMAGWLKENGVEVYDAPEVSLPDVQMPSLAVPAAPRRVGGPLVEPGAAFDPLGPAPGAAKRKPRVVVQAEEPVIPILGADLELDEAQAEPISTEAEPEFA